MSYEILIERAAQKSLAKIEETLRKRIADAIRKLSQKPRPTGAKKLSGREAWRIRVGDHRVIYEIHDDRLLVLVVRIAHRRDVYR